MLDSPAMLSGNARRISVALACLGGLAALPAAAQERTPGWEFGPGARLAAPGFEFQLAGYVQEDFRSFHDYEDASGQLPVLGEGAVLRRLRMGFDAKWKRLSFEVDVDPHD